MMTTTANPTEPLHFRALRNLRRRLEDVVKSSLKPPPKLDMPEWADTYRHLPDNSAEAGRWRTSRVQVAREPMESITLPEVQEVTVMCCIQLMKALAIDTPIPTPAGWTTMGSLHVGDRVFGRDGKPCRVLAKSDIKTANRCFRVVFSDGAEVIADAGHKWLVDDSRNRTSTQCTRVTNTLEISQTFKSVLSDGRLANRYAIPVADPLELPEADLLIAPYTFGAWLGDGHSYSSRFTNHAKDHQIIDELMADGYAAELKSETATGTREWLISTVRPTDECPYGHPLEPGRRCRTCASLRSNPRRQNPQYSDRKNKRMHQLLVELNVLQNKHIPALYMRASHRQRLELLQGLMDTDGTISKQGNASFCSKDERLALQVVELLRSLGFKPGVHRTRVAYHVNFVAYADTPIFKLHRKRARQKPISAKTRVGETKRRRIVDVVEVSPVPVQCIAVDSPDHLYLCGEGMIPTHNTELMINAALYFIHQEPSPIMYVAPKKETAEAWSKERFMKSAMATPVTRDVFSSNRRGEGNTILQKQFPGGQISIVSARNPTDLAMRACRIMLFDECDKYPLNVGAGEGGSGGEGDPIQVAWGRSTTYGKRAKKITACSPTVEGRSRIHQEYLKSDQREYHQPCSHCGHSEVLNWEKHVHIPEDDKGTKLPDGAVIICHECGSEWTESDRFRSIAEGCWIPKRPEIKHHRGYWASAFASPFTPITTLAREYVDALDNPQAMKAFINTRMAQVYREIGEAPDWQRLYERRESYAPCTVPNGGLMVTVGIDVQKDYLIYEAVAWGRKKVSWSIDIGVIDGHISEDATRENLSKFMETRYTNAAGIPMAIELALIDSSNDTSEVYSAVAQIGTPRLRAIKGQGNLTTIVGTPKPVQIDINGIRRDGGIKMWPLGVNVLKEQLYKWLLLPRPTDEHLAAGGEWPTGYCHFPEWGDDYFKQLTAEILIERSDSKGFLVRSWETIRDHNHYLDCRGYARAAASMLGLDRMADEDFKEREKHYGATSSRPPDALSPDLPAEPEPAPEAERPRKKRPARFFKKGR
uniref:terminase gpA endonuclease subunit n=1 Tax=Marinobacterium profundum TaxID=1714300 RepID=UPI000AD11D11|nr:terminase gpA endonuclease subunit [Marinobacterium profundum]